MKSFIKNSNSQVTHLDNLTNAITEELRNSVQQTAESNFTKAIIDAKNVTEADLCGINEIIHSYYILKKVNKELMLVYRKDSVVEKWVETTKLNQFIEVAILPSK